MRPGSEAADPFTLGWQGAFVYFRRGLATLRRSPGVHLQVLALYAAPALLAAYLSAGEPYLWQQIAIASLPWVTVVLGTVVVMIVVSHQAHGRSIGVGAASCEALAWVPRYLWTNVHTSLIFWLPVGLLLRAREHLVAILSGTTIEPAANVAWWTITGAVALGLHTRTLLAPFLAIHSDLPGTLAALEAWRLSGRHFAICLATFIVASLPVGLPLALLSLLLLLTLPAPGQAAFVAAAPSLVWAGIQAIRPLLIPAVYALYQDLWRHELQRRQREGDPSTPGFARALLAITRPLPNPRYLSDCHAQHSPCHPEHSPCHPERSEGSERSAGGAQTLGKSAILEGPDSSLRSE
jgi:hypothetical protein